MVKESSNLYFLNILWIISRYGSIYRFYQTFQKINSPERFENFMFLSLQKRAKIFIFKIFQISNKVSTHYKESTKKNIQVHANGFIEKKNVFLIYFVFSTKFQRT
jgi:hypothetical protein